MTTRRIVLVLLVLLGIVVATVFACNGPQGELDEHRELWERLGSENYTFEYRRFCECPDAGIPVRVTVTGELIESVVYAQPSATGEYAELSVFDNGFPQYYTIDDLFDTIERAIARPRSIRSTTYDVTVTYDDEFGYPRDFSIYNPEADDDGYDLKIDAYVPL